MPPVIPSEVEGSRDVTFKLAPRDPSTSLGMTERLPYNYLPNQPRRIKLTAIAASNNDTSFETPLIPCLPIHFVSRSA